MKWMRIMAATANGGRPVLPVGACGVITSVGSARSTTRFIPLRKSRLRVLLVTSSNPMQARPLFTS
jgi:hypothetical protein